MKLPAPNVALITGAASGLGRAVAIKLSETVPNLVLWDMNLSGLQETAASCGKSKVMVEQVDMSNASLVEARMGALVNKPQFILHAAGILRTGGLGRVTSEDARKMVEVNYLGTVNLVLSAANAMPPQSQIFCISSIAGVKGLPEFPAYCGSKFAVVGFCEAMHEDLRQKGIHLSVVCPPAVDTPMVQNLGYRPALYDLFPFAEKNDVVNAIVGRMGKPGALLIMIDAQSRLLKALNGMVPGVVSSVLNALVARHRKRLPPSAH